MKRLLIALVLAPLASVIFAGPAHADPPVVHEEVAPAHSHHVHTGNGGCVDIDSVFFLPETRGLHRGANASQGHLAGPYHGRCH